MKDPCVTSGLAFPVHVIAQTFAILEIGGSGNTNTAVVLVEEQINPARRWVATFSIGIDSSRIGLKLFGIILESRSRSPRSPTGWVTLKKRCLPLSKFDENSGLYI